MQSNDRSTPTLHRIERTREISRQCAALRSLAKDASESVAERVLKDNDPAAYAVVSLSRAVELLTDLYEAAALQSLRSAGK